MYTKKYYKKDSRDRNTRVYKKYADWQIRRSKRKLDKYRDPEEYSVCFEYLQAHLKHDFTMLCLGTRNNHERDVFQELAKSYDGYVCSQDICPRSNANIIGDFNFLSELTNDKWDVIYSNSIDHALDAVKAFEEWLKVLQDDGIMILGFDFSVSKVKPADCNVFSVQSVKQFMKNRKDIVVLDRFQSKMYHYWMVQKK